MQEACRQARRLGQPEADLLAAYPKLDAGQLARAFAYAADHAEEIAREIEANESA